MFICYRCGHAVNVGRTVGRTEPCPYCDADLHCCRNCSFHDATVHHECREPQAEPVSDKEKGNFCDYFRFKALAAAQPGTGSAQRVREKLDQLFKKKE